MAVWEQSFEETRADLEQPSEGFSVDAERG